MSHTLTTEQLIEIAADASAQNIIIMQLLFAIVAKVGADWPFTLDQHRRLIMQLADGTEDLMRKRVGLGPRPNPREPSAKHDDDFEKVDWENLMEF